MISGIELSRPGESIHLESVTVPSRTSIPFYQCLFYSAQSDFSLPRQKQEEMRRLISLVDHNYSII